MKLNNFTAEAFWARVNKTNTCWLWIGGSISDGYGTVSRCGLMEKCHRVSWILTYGNIPPNKLVLHICDNTLCVNPDHLFLGTNADNTLDMINKGRSYHPNFKGELNNASVLTENNVKHIRALHPFISQTNLVLLFNTTQNNISRIINRKRWKSSWNTEEENIAIRNQYASQYT